MKNKLRLLLFEKCNRNCVGCCNKDWNLSILPIEDDFRHYRLIILTGGEPMLDPDLVIDTAKRIRKVNDCPIILYTAKIDDIDSVFRVLEYLDGMTLTLHDYNDWIPFVLFNTAMISHRLFEKYDEKSFRLNIFREVFYTQQKYFPKDYFPNWKIKNNIEWIRNCPLPEDEVFCRLERRLR